MKLFSEMVKWIIILLLSLSMGLVAIIFLSSQLEITAYLMRLILLVAISFISALAARTLYGRIPAILALLLSLTASLCAVLIIDHFYETGYQLRFLSNNFRVQALNAGDISQLILMTLVSLPPLLVFRRHSTTIRRSYTFKMPGLKQARESLSRLLVSFLNKIDPRNWKLWKKLKKIQITKQTLKKPATIERPVVSITRSVIAKNNIPPVTIRKKKPAKPAVKKLTLPGKLFKGNSADVKLVGEEEHCCPYCLEEVVLNDSRGVKVCPECGTWHHQDCWNLTGSCGVAHRNEL